jgi:preprotein translocase subunit YajC
MNALPMAMLLQAQAPSPLNSFLIPMVLVFAIFYLLLIRPQNKQRQEHQKMLESVDKGDEVVTAGGLHGRVVGTTADLLTLEIANVKGERVRVKVDRKSIERRTARGTGEGEEA